MRFKPTYKGWKFRGEHVFVPGMKVLSLPTRDGNSFSQPSGQNSPLVLSLPTRDGNVVLRLGDELMSFVLSLPTRDGNPLYPVGTIK